MLRQGASDTHSEAYLLNAYSQVPQVRVSKMKRVGSAVSKQFGHPGKRVKSAHIKNSNVKARVDSGNLNSSHSRHQMLMNKLTNLKSEIGMLDLSALRHDMGLK